MQTQKTEEESVAGECEDVLGGSHDLAAELTTITVVAAPTAAPSDKGPTSPAALKDMAKDYITAYKIKLEFAAAQDQILKSCAYADGLHKRFILLKDRMRESIADSKTQQVAQELDQHPGLAKRLADSERLLAVLDEVIPASLSTYEQQDMEAAQQDFSDKADDVVAAFSMLDASLEDDASPLGHKLVEISNECDSQPEVARERVKKLVLPSNFNTIEAVIKTTAHLQGTADSAVMPTQDDGDGHEEGEVEGKGKGATVGADGQS